MAVALLAAKGGARPASPADTAAAEPAARRKAANGNGTLPHLAALDGGPPPEPATVAAETPGDGDPKPAASLTSAHFLRPYAPPAPESVLDAATAEEVSEAVAEVAAEPQIEVDPQAAMPSLDPDEAVEVVEPATPALEALDGDGDPQPTATIPQLASDSGSPGGGAPDTKGPDTERPEAKRPEAKRPEAKRPDSGALDPGALEPTVAALNAYPARGAAARREQQRRNNGTLAVLIVLGTALAIGVGWYSINLRTPADAPGPAPLDRPRDAVSATQPQAGPQVEPRAGPGLESEAMPPPSDAVAGDGADYLSSPALGAGAPQQAAAPVTDAAEPEAPAVDVVRIEAGSAVIAGTGEPGSALIVLDKGEPIGTAAVDGNGQWVLIPDVVLPEGDHEISLVVKDEQATVRIPKKE